MLGYGAKEAKRLTPQHYMNARFAVSVFIKKLNKEAKMKRQILLMFLLTAALAGCGGGGDKKPAAGPGGPAMPPPEVDVITVSRARAT